MAGQSQCRLQIHRFFLHFIRGIHPVGRDPGSCKVVSHIRKIDDPRAVITVKIADRNAPLLNLLLHPHKSLVLHHGISLICFVRFREMGKHSLEPDIWQPADPFYDICAFLTHRKADPAHSGVDLNMEMCRLSKSDSRPGDRIRHLFRVYSRTDIIVQHILVLIRKYASKDKDRLLYPVLPQIRRLFQTCHCIAPHIRKFFKHLCDRDSAVTVSVCLDNSDQFCIASDPVPHLFHIIRDGVEIDLGAYTIMLFHFVSLLYILVFLLHTFFNPGDQIAGKDTVTALCFFCRISAACMEEHTERSALVCLHSLSGKPCDHTGKYIP